MGGITGQLKLVEQAAYLKPETAERALASRLGWLELVPAGQLSVLLVSVTGVKEQQLSLAPSHLLSLPQGVPSGKSGGDNLSQSQSPHCKPEEGGGRTEQEQMGNASSLQGPQKHSSQGPLSITLFLRQQREYTG